MTTSHSQRASFQITSQVAAYGSICRGTRTQIRVVSHALVRKRHDHVRRLNQSELFLTTIREGRAQRIQGIRVQSSLEKKKVEAEKSTCLRSALKLAPVPLSALREKADECTSSERRLPKEAQRLAKTFSHVVPFQA